MEIMKKWMTVILSICVMVLMFGGDVFAHSESDSKDEDTGLYYYDEDDKITITGYDGSAKDLVIPETIDGKPVTKIENQAFRDCESLESIEMPDTVTSIGDQVFDGCINLTNIKLSDELESIGILEFRDCSSLSSIEIPNSVTSIGDEVFDGCKNLTDIKLSDELESIGILAFRDCSSLSRIEIPDSVTSIGNNAFAGCKNAKIYVTAGSYAEQYLKDNNIDYYYTEYYPEDLNVELAITNNTGMFKAVSASVEVKDGSAFLIMALASTGYQKLFKGTYEQAVANGNDTDNWIHGYTNDAGKWEFRIPLLNGKTFVPLVAISESYYQKYLDGQNSLERAFYPRYVKVDIDAATLETGDYEYTADLAVTNYEDGFNLNGAALTTIGGPNSNNFKCQLELTMEDDTYNKVFVGDVDEITDDSEMINIGEGGLFAIPVKWVETVGRPETMKNLLADPFVLSFYSSNDEQWHMYEFTVDEDENSLEIRQNSVDISDFEYSYIPNGAKIVKYKGSASNVVIPDTINRESVLRIENQAFRDCESLKSIEMPDTVTSMGDQAFAGCENLTNIKLSNKLESIGVLAFGNCISLSSIEIPDSVTSIGEEAFVDCKNLTNIKLSNKLESIGICAFRNCSSLSRIEIPDSVSSIGNKAFFGCEKLKIYVTKDSYAEEYLKDNNIEYFYKDLNKELTITNTSDMFKAVSASIEVKDGSAFLIMALASTGYHELFKGTYEQAVANGNDTDNWIHGYTNDAGKWEFRIPLPNEKTFVPLVAISDNYYQKYLNGQNSLERAFYPRYVKVDIDAATLETGDYEYTADLAVTNYEDGFNLTGAALTTIGGPNSNNFKCQLELTMEDDTYYKVFIGAVDEITDDSEMINIGEGGLFAIPVKWVETVGRPETMKNLLADPFVLSFYSSNDEQWHMYEFTVDEDENSLEIIQNTVDISDFEYSYIPNGVKIEKYKGSASNVVIPDTIGGKPVIQIENQAFRDCESLKSIEMPDTVTSIRDQVFDGCINLTNIKLSDELESIGILAFRDCSSLSSIEIPNSVTSIGDEVFDGCKNLTDIKLSNKLESIGGLAFRNCSSLSSIEIPDSVTNIGESAFWNCSSLKSIEIPDSVTSIGNYVFDGCSKLVSIKLSNKLKTIGGSVFKYCNSLKNVELPESITSIGDSAFWDCSSLESIEIPNSVTSIDYGAFTYCSSLKSIKIPDSVISIGEIAFGGCDNAKFYVIEGSYAEEYLKENNIPYEYIKEEDPTEAPSEKKSETPTVSPDNNKTKAPAKVNLKSAKNLKGKKLKAIWKKITGAKGYEVQYSTNKKFKKAKTKTTKKTTFVIKKLKKKKTYYVRVRAYTIDASGKKVPGKWSKVKKVKVTK